ncbi:CRAL-TRIO domain-containing protein [Trichonephila clavipes]|nr:CRAL-TRIO domain-containing protein [Trichonephila clavipes]
MFWKIPSDSLAVDGDDGKLSWTYIVLEVVIRDSFLEVHCVPVRYKELHFVNQSIIVKPCWAMLRPFLSEKLRNRAYFHSNVEELLNYFPPSVLPAEYGGDLKENIEEDWLRKANKEHENYGATGQPSYF